MASLEMRVGRIWLILLLTIIFLQTASIQFNSPAYATHQTKNVVWQIVVVSSEPVCTISHYQMAQKYHIIAEEYFKLYQFDTSHYQPECYSQEKFDWKYEKPNDLDLLILIYDRDLGREKLHPFEMGGFYSHSGGDINLNHTIVMCECSTFNYSDPPWILSHELSHFILNYLGFDLTTAEEQIHYADFKYDYCIEESYEDFCKSVGTLIENKDLGYKVKVMKPYQPAIGFNLSNNVPEIEYESKGLELFKEITKWWHDGKITYTEYSDSLKILTGQNFEEVSFGTSMKDSGTLILAEPSKKTKVMSEDIQEKSNTEILDTFSFIDAPNSNPIFSGKYPDWFKTRAMLWTNNQISDEEFATSVDFLKKSIIEPEKNTPPSLDQQIEKIKLLVEDKEFDEALALVDLAIENNNDSDLIQSELFLLKGTILYNLEKYYNALIFIDASLENNSENVDAMKAKAQTLIELGEDQAQEYYDKIKLYENQEN